MVDINSDIEIIGVSIKNTNERTKEKEVIVKYKVKDIYNVSSNIDTKSKDNIFKTLMERIKEFFYS